jgi:hypothetical protein
LTPLLEWVPNRGPFATGASAMRGHVKLFIVCVDNTRTELAWCMRCLLPGLRDMNGPYATEDEGRAHAERCFMDWLNQLHLDYE